PRRPNSLQRCRRDLGVKGIELETRFIGDFRQESARPRLGRNVERADVVSAPIDVERVEQRVYRVAVRQEAVDGDECVVLRVTERVASGSWPNVRARWLRESSHWCKGTVECIEDAIELQRHLIRQSPPREVIR